ncbi:hypothetical protein R1flu_004668 [Riccia fluitans]|uniref:Uncharacterized protein n=1 Tax=Riccia fluitans TaxID=41844 RepID=A0ABD1YTV2_9MARC
MAAIIRIDENFCVAVQKSNIFSARNLPVVHLPEQDPPPVLRIECRGILKDFGSSYAFTFGLAILSISTSPTQGRYKTLEIICPVGPTSYDLFPFASYLN